MDSGEKIKSDQNCSETPQRRGTKRSLLSGRQKVHSGFKSPVQVSSTLSNRTCIQEEIRELQNTLLQLESDITLLESEGVCVHELDLHINLLHEYNDMKDTAQTLLGRLAGLRGVTTRDLYAEFGMDLDD